MGSKEYEARCCGPGAGAVDEVVITVVVVEGLVSTPQGTEFSPVHSHLDRKYAAACEQVMLREMVASL